jgi:RNA polymerase sigma-70 factor (ECF subfamily)
MSRRDPLADPAPLIRTIYAYASYRVGPGAEAEDVTSEVFERALRYRSGYDPKRGEPIAWLLGIARRCIADSVRPATGDLETAPEAQVAGDLEVDAVRRLTLASALEGLDERERELVALRFGADLTARQIGDVLGMKTNAVEVALHRTLARLRTMLETSSAPSRRLHELQTE